MSVIVLITLSDTQFATLFNASRNSHRDPCEALEDIVSRVIDQIESHMRPPDPQ